MKMWEKVKKQTQKQKTLLTSVLMDKFLLWGYQSIL